MRKISIENVILGCLVFFALVILISFFNVISISQRKETKERELVSMSNGQSLHGSFFLGTGQINGVMKYRYLYRDNGNIRYSESTATCSYIKETQDKPVLIMKKRYERCGCTWCSHFYIPMGSIKYNYNIDIEKSR
jgi:hypothetical protein